MTRFPVADLVPVGGEIHGLLFENPRTRLPLNVYWSFRLDFQPIQYQGEEMQCNLMSDWIQVGIRDWRHLEHKSIDCCGGFGETTFYCCAEHQWAKQSLLQFGARNGDAFNVQWQLVVDFTGMRLDDRDPDLTMSKAGSLTFEGIYIPKDLELVSPEPANVARNTLPAFVDLDRFGAIVDHQRHLLLLPR